MSVRRDCAGLLCALAVWAVPLSVAQARTVALPGGAATGASQHDVLYQVACPTAGDCVSVGSYLDASGATQALIESEAGGIWSAANVPDGSLPDAGPTPHPDLTGVSCPFVGDCIAVDAYNDGNGFEQGLIDAESDGVWTPIAAPLTGLNYLTAYLPGPGVEVYDVACPAAATCVAVGTYTGADHYAHGLIEVQSGGGWSPLEAPTPPNANVKSQPTFFDLSCASVGNCAAVGDYLDNSPGGGALEGWLETERDGDWATGELDLSDLAAGGYAPAADPEVSLNSVSCPSPGSCTAVGTYEDAAGSYEGLVTSQVGGAWQPAARVALPNDASTTAVGGTEPAQSDLFLNGVSCASVGNCTAVGSYDAADADTPAANVVEGLTLTESGGVWGAGLETSLPAGAASDPEASLDSVTCQAAAACLAAGTYVDAAGDNEALVARQDPSGWSSAGADLATAYDGPDGSSSASVSCAADGYCAAGGYATDAGTGSSQAFELNAPGPPTGTVASLSARPTGTQANVSWSPPADGGGLPTIGYAVTATDETDAARGGQSVSVSAGSTEALVSGLTPGDTYTFTVTASSLLGVGLPASSPSLSLPDSPGQISLQPSEGPPVAESPTVTAAVNGPSRAQLSASLARILEPSAATLRAARLPAARGYRLTYRSLEAGRVSLDWYLISRSGRSPRRSLIASGAAVAKRAGSVTVSVRLTAAGRRILRSHRNPRLTAVVSFSAGGLRVSRTGRFASLF